MSRGGRRRRRAVRGVAVREQSGTRRYESRRSRSERKARLHAKGDGAIAGNREAAVTAAQFDLAFVTALNDGSRHEYLSHSGLPDTDFAAADGQGDGSIGQLDLAAFHGQLRSLVGGDGERLVRSGGRPRSHLIEQARADGDLHAFE